MEFLSVTELPERSGGFDQDWHFKGRRVFLVEVDVMDADETLVALAPGIPRPYEHHPGYYFALAGQAEAMQCDSDAPWFWKVTVPYSSRSKDPDRESKDKDQTPIEEPPEIEWSHGTRQKLFTESPDDTAIQLIRGGINIGEVRFAPVGSRQPVQTSAGEKLDQVPQEEDRFQVLKITRNELTYDDFFAESFFDTTNLKKFFGRRPGTMRCTVFNGRRAFSKNLSYYKVHYEFEYDSDGWVRDFPDMGSLYISTSSDATSFAGFDDSGIAHDNKGNIVDGVLLRPKIFYDPRGLRYHGKLNGRGGKAVADPVLVPSDINPANPLTTYLRYRRFPRKDFGSLKLSNI